MLTTAAMIDRSDELFCGFHWTGKTKRLADARSSIQKSEHCESKRMTAHSASRSLKRVRLGRVHKEILECISAFATAFNDDMDSDATSDSFCGENEDSTYWSFGNEPSKSRANSHTGSFRAARPCN
jgi:hypothetical protein